MRCASGGRACEGYDKTAIAHHPAIEVASSYIPVTAASTACLSGPAETPSTLPPIIVQPQTAFAPVNIKPNLSDMTMFDALRFQIVGLVAGSFDQTFWSVDVLQACQVQPAIWHASLSLAALYQSQQEQTIESFRRPRHKKLSMTHYAASVHHVIALTRQQQLSTAEKESLLLASMLLTAICSLQGDLQQAVMHCSNGIELFHQWRFWELYKDSPAHRGSLLSAGSIRTIIAHFELQLASRVKRVTLPTWGEPGFPPRCSDIHFSSPTDAYHEFQPLVTSLIGLWQYAGLPAQKAQPLPETDIRYPYVVEFLRWKHKYDELVVSNHGTIDSESMMILYLHWHGMQILLKANIQEGEVAFDEFLPVFRDVLTLARELSQVLRHKKGTGPADRYPKFSFATSVVEGLFWAGHGCRDALVRREFLSLIREWPRRDGIWDNSLMAAILETSIALEENAWKTSRDAQPWCCCIAGSFICNSHRINGHRVEFLPSGRARVHFETIHDKEAKLPGYVVVLP